MLSPPLQRAHNIRKAPSYSETSFTVLPGLGPGSKFKRTGEYRATARHMAVMRVRGGANLNCTFQIWAIFSHPWTAYRQLKFCVQSLLDGLCKRANFQARFRHDKPLVSQCAKSVSSVKGQKWEARAAVDSVLRPLRGPVWIIKTNITGKENQ
jgi:hypothetical protein